MVIEHNSQNCFYRDPFGAVPCLSTIVLRLFASTDEIPRSVKVAWSLNSKESTSTMYYYNSILNGSIYETSIKLTEETGLLWYYFIVETNSSTIYYGNNESHLGGIGSSYVNKPPSFQITIYKRDLITPEWFKKSIVYQIFPDRFCKGHFDSFSKGRTDIIKREWKDTPFYKPEQFGGTYLSNDFFGGNLTGILEKLPYLADLGISTIYLNPIFKAFSNHKYDTGDYEEIDPMFGTNKIFEDLCKNAKELGISIILDGVFNHTGSDSKYFNKDLKYPSIGAYQSKASQYYNWYKFNQFPDDYECWWGISTLPHVNEFEPSFLDYMLKSKDSIVKKWIRLGARGWRLDVADELPDEFIKQLRLAVKEVASDAIIIGEVWEDASNKVSYSNQKEYLLGEELDSVMNYPLRSAIIDYACCEINADTFAKKIMSLKENYPKEVFYSLMNFVSTHDVPRILTSLSNIKEHNLQVHNTLSRDEKALFSLDEVNLSLAKARFKLVILLQMTLPGVPCIFYGDEVGLQGLEDPFNRRTYPWGKEDKEILYWHKQFIKLRNSFIQLISGEFEVRYCFKTAFAFSRYDNEKLLIICVNTSTTEAVFTRLDLAKFAPNEITDIETNEVISAMNGVTFFDLPPLGYKLIEAQQDKRMN